MAILTLNDDQVLALVRQLPGGVAICTSGEVLAGVGRQYNGRLGKVDLSQVGVFLSIIKDGKHKWIDGELYLPEAWFDEDHKALRERADVPE